MLALGSGRAIRCPASVSFEKKTAIKKAIEQFLIMLGASLEGEWENQIRYVPM